MPMADQAHDFTDKRIDSLAVKFHEAYSQAANEMQDRLEKWLADYDRENKQWIEDVKSGVRTKKQYEHWLSNMASDKSWQQGMIDRLSIDAVNADMLCNQAINDEIPTVYAENANYAAFDVDHKIGYDTGFTLYDVDTVRNLITDTPTLLPQVDVAKDLLWNQQKFASAITQSILQGESIPNVAKRLSSVFSMGEASSIRAARTACTSAENAGRISSYKRAESIGIRLRQQWYATLDGRTRLTHRLLHNQKVPVGGVFVPEGYDPERYSIRFPGDPRALGEMVWNCRCTLMGAVDGVDQDDAEHWSNLPDDVTYEEWRHGKYVTDKNGKETVASMKARGVYKE